MVHATLEMLLQQPLDPLRPKQSSRLDPLPRETYAEISSQGLWVVKAMKAALDEVLLKRSPSGVALDGAMRVELRRI